MRGPPGVLRFSGGRGVSKRSVVAGPTGTSHPVTQRVGTPEGVSAPVGAGGASVAWGEVLPRPRSKPEGGPGEDDQETRREERGGEDLYQVTQSLFTKNRQRGEDRGAEGETEEGDSDPWGKRPILSRRDRLSN